MEVEELKSILKNHKLRITNCRMDVVKYFLEEDRALSQGDLEHHLTAYDRVTLYRTLNSFLVSGILHKIPNESGTATYGLCHKTCTPGHHTHDHLHFKCNECGKIECLNTTISLSPFSLPDGYAADHIHVIVDGLCRQCN